MELRTGGGVGYASPPPKFWKIEMLALSLVIFGMLLVLAYGAATHGMIIIGLVLFFGACGALPLALIFFAPEQKPVLDVIEGEQK
jgi:hypothetical protein